MKKQKKGGLSALTEILRGVTRRNVLSLRRFSRRGGFGGLFSRTLANLRRGNLRTILNCCLVVLLLGGGIWGVLSLSAARQNRASTALAAGMSDAKASQDTNVVSLEADLARLQANATPA
ncbi:MAG: hypothetical protein EOM66_08705, partial [Clostridia bacterium]|nr:hypothetical protein [Clostridia bacterium]